MFNIISKFSTNMKRAIQFVGDSKMMVMWMGKVVMRRKGSRNGNNFQYIEILDS